MKTTVSLYDFRDAFQRIRPTNFTYEGLEALFDYLEQYEQDCGQELELDVISICCDFSEDTWINIAEYYSINLEGCDNDEERMEKVKEYLEDEGAFVGEVEGGFVYRNL